MPAIVVPGCLDMVNFYAPESVPTKFAGRTFYHHSPQATLLRTTPEECAQLGRILAEKVNLSTGPVTVLLPKKAISVISAEGQPFHDPVADASALQRNQVTSAQGHPGDYELRREDHRSVVRRSVHEDSRTSARVLGTRHSFAEREKNL